MKRKLIICLIAFSFILTAFPQTTFNSSYIYPNSEYKVEDQIPDQPKAAKETDVAINYAPLLGFWIGPWPLSTNLSIARGYFESSTTLAITPESDSNPNALAFYTLIGPRYVFPSKSDTHFFVHGLVGAGIHKESREENGIFMAYDYSHVGVYLSPGVGIYSKKPSKPGFRFGLDLVISPGFPTDIWATSFAGAFQLSIGLVF